MSVEQQHFYPTYPAHTRNANGPLVLSQMPHREQRPLLFPEPPPLIFLEDGPVFDPDEDALPAPVPPEASIEALESITPTPEIVPPAPAESQQETVATPDSATATTPPPDAPAYWTRRRIRLAGGASGAFFLLVIV